MSANGMVTAMKNSEKDEHTLIDMIQRCILCSVGNGKFAIASPTPKDHANMAGRQRKLH